MTKDKLSKVQELEIRFSNEINKLENKMQGFIKDLDSLRVDLNSTRQTAKKNRGQINELKINVVQLQEKINYFVTKVDDFISHSNTHTNEIIKSIDSIKPNTFKTNMTYSVMVFVGMTVGTIIIQMIINNLV